MKTILCALVALLLAACGTAPEVTQAMLAAHVAQQAQPTITLRCPSGGCEMSYTDPRDRRDFRAPTNGWDAAIAIGGNLTGIAQAAVVPLTLGKVAVEGMRSLKGSGAVANTTTTSTSSTTGPVATTTTGATVTRNTTVGANSGAGSGTTTTTSSASNTSTVGANSGANSGNTSAVGDNSGAGSGNNRGNPVTNTSTSTQTTATSTNTSTSTSTTTPPAPTTP